jgi:hypothetical protein
MRPTRAVAVAFVLLSSAASLFAETVNHTFTFETDKWFSLDDAKEGPVTLHRIQIARSGLGTKQSLLRPGNADYLAGVEIQLEYTNTATRDWQARFRVAWLDDAGREIDGYNGSEGLDEGENHQIETIKIATLKYGLERARKLRVVIDCRPE